MNQTQLPIKTIPAIIWGEKSDDVIIAVHGNQSNKSDVPIEILAEIATEKNYQVLSFDLPEHGDRKTETIPCKVQYCINDLTQVMEFAKVNWKNISLFANSIGAYFSLLAYKNELLKKAWFLSPVVDMERIITNMMSWFKITEAELERKQTIATPIGQVLYWDYFCYVKEHPIKSWPIPTLILYGDKDNMHEYDIILNFKNHFGCHLTVLPDCEHYFHTPEQLSLYESWLKETI